jgi:16S rRNA (adenine1518-N6/adenine1519-N6)-dimethyltransferase
VNKYRDITIKKPHKAKKSLGQNFLKSILALNKIVEAGEINENDTILEIGPGKGALTEKLLEKGCKVIAVEKDRDLIEFLQEKFQKEIENKRFFLIENDILEIEVGEVTVLKNIAQADEPSIAIRKHADMCVFQNNNLPCKKSKSAINYKIIANIPYNITGAILKKFLTDENQPERMVLMVQNEVAQRIIARDGKESILSVSVKAYGEPKIIMKVAKRYFSPAPKVDSAVILIKNISRKLFMNNKIDEDLFWEVIHAGFAHKRKMLISNLKDFYVKQNLEKGLTENQIQWNEVFQKNNLNIKTRAEELNISDWINILKDINTQK